MKFGCEKLSHALDKLCIHTEKEKLFPDHLLVNEATNCTFPKCSFKLQRHFKICIYFLNCNGNATSHDDAKVCHKNESLLLV